MNFITRYRNSIQITLFCIGLAILGLFVYNSGIIENYEIISSVNIPTFILALCCTFGVIFLRVYRWKYLSEWYKPDVAWKDATLATISSLFYANITPAKFGDLYKAYFMKRVYKMNLTDGVSMIFYERFFELVILFLAASAIVFIQLSGVTVIVLEVIAVILILLLIFYYKIDSLIQFIQKVSVKIPFFKNISLDIQVRKMSFPRIVGVFFITLISLSLEFLQLWLVACAFGYVLNPIIITILFSLSIIIGLVSQIPLSMGVMEGSLSYFLMYLGVTSVDSMAIVLTDRIISMYLVIIIGFIVSKLSSDRIIEVHL
ncbi:MAG TPA: lysylphosphatidylglycerol synthase transmembrane domain-containing protein [Methanoregulaceae archaeon]|nr:lysylphosphatidylglycerol synthase transmembrane domain-containing protein [Methanoregulaceae archaeon]